MGGKHQEGEAFLFMAVVEQGERGPGAPHLESLLRTKPAWRGETAWRWAGLASWWRQNAWTQSELKQDAPSDCQLLGPINDQFPSTGLMGGFCLTQPE